MVKFDLGMGLPGITFAGLIAGAAGDLAGADFSAVFSWANDIPAHETQKTTANNTAADFLIYYPLFCPRSEIKFRVFHAVRYPDLALSKYGF
jgi:hypothetical protein